MKLPTPLPSLLAACLAMAGCSGTQSRADGAADGESGAAVTIEPMSTSSTSTAKAGIPPIDAEAPAEYRTATFALG